ncbi:MAG: flippase-like domain-containing protein [Actinobacteria bacterium]|nr:flippase-like domain-containing protein [Actinomycetota bacterium]
MAAASGSGERIFGPRRLIRAVLIAALMSGVVYAVLIVLGDGSEVASALRGFPPPTLAWMLLLGLAGFVVRALRWGALMRVLGHPVRTRDALYLHVAGQTMSVTPGRVGEVLKPWLAREVGGMPMSHGIPLVFAERVADLIAVCVLALGGLAALGGSAPVLVAWTAVIVGGTALAGAPWFHSLALKLVRRQEWSRKHEGSAQAIAETLSRALHWRTLAWSVPVSLLAWGLEGIGLVLCIRALGFDALGWAASVSVYAVATIAGAFSFLPGGIGLTEASMAGILVATGMPAAAASAATLVTRVATLWWSVSLGWVALASRPAVLKRVLGGEPPEE